MNKEHNPILYTLEKIEGYPRQRYFEFHRAVETPWDSPLPAKDEYEVEHVPVQQKCWYFRDMKTFISFKHRFENIPLQVEVDKVSGEVTVLHNYALDKGMQEFVDFLTWDKTKKVESLEVTIICQNQTLTKTNDELFSIRSERKSLNNLIDKLRRENHRLLRPWWKKLFNLS